MPEPVTLVKNAIHNPSDARHFMRISESGYLVTASVGGVEIARSRRTRKVKEVGRDIYDPVLYFPREDVDMARLARSDRTTHCPLKGDTTYFDLDAAGERLPDAAWSYTRTLDLAADLRDRIAFDARLVQVTEHTAAE